MLDRLLPKGMAIAHRRVDRAVDALLRLDLPSGVTAARDEAGIVLSGKGLRRRLTRDIRLRSLAALVRGACATNRTARCATGFSR